VSSAFVLLRFVQRGNIESCIHTRTEKVDIALILSKCIIIYLDCFVHHHFVFCTQKTRARKKHALQETELTIMRLEEENKKLREFIQKLGTFSLILRVPQAQNDATPCQMDAAQLLLDVMHNIKDTKDTTIQNTGPSKPAGDKNSDTQSDTHSESESNSSLEPRSSSSNGNGSSRNSDSNGGADEDGSVSNSNGHEYYSNYDAKSKAQPTPASSCAQGAQDQSTPSVDSGSAGQKAEQSKSPQLAGAPSATDGGSEEGQPKKESFKSTKVLILPPPPEKKNVGGKRSRPEDGTQEEQQSDNSSSIKKKVKVADEDTIKVEEKASTDQASTDHHNGSASTQQQEAIEDSNKEI